MEFGKSFTYILDEEDWVLKILLAAVIIFIPIIGGFAVAGWGIEITRRVIQKEEELLPDWGDFINYLIKGLVAVLIGFVYMLPIILFQVCANGVLAFGLESGDDALATFSGIVMTCFGCFTFIYAILVSFLIYAAMGRYADTGEIGSAFQFGEVFAIVKAAPAAYLLVLVGGFLAGLLAFFGVLACVIGVFFTAAYANAVNAHLMGQAYAEAKMAMGGGNDLQAVPESF